MKNIFIQTVANGFVVRDADVMRSAFGAVGVDLDTHVFRDVNDMCRALPRLLGDEHTVFAEPNCCGKPGK